MADEVVDGLIIESKFDESGLSDSERAQVEAVRSFVNQINQMVAEIDPLNIDVAQLSQQLTAAGGDAEAFFAGMEAGAQDATAEILKLAAQVREVPPPAPPAPVATPTPLNVNLDQALAEFTSFYDAVGQMATDSAQTQVAELRKFADEANDVLDLKSFDTSDAVAQVSELAAAFEPLAAKLDQFDPSGKLSALAEEARGAVEQLREFADASLQAAAAQTEFANAPKPDIRAPEAAVLITDDQINGAHRLAEAEAELGAKLLESANGTKRSAGAMQQLADAESRVETNNSRLSATVSRTAASMDQLSAANALQAINALKAGAATEFMGNAALRAQQQHAEAQRMASAAAQSAAPDLNLLARGYESLAIAERQAQIAAEGFVETMKRTGQEVRKGGSANAQASAQITGLGAAMRGLSTGSVEAGRGMDRLRGAMVTLASRATGVPGPIGTIVSTLLTMSAGSTAVIAIAAGIGAIALAYNVLTKAARESKEATEGFIKAQNEAALNRDPLGALLRQIDGVPGKIEGASAAITRLGRELEALQAKQRNRELIPSLVAPGIDTKDFFGLQGREIADLQGKLADVEAAIQETAKQVSDMVAREIRAMHDATQQAFLQSIQDDLALQRSGFAAREAQVRQAFATEQLTAEQFYAARIGLARQAAAKEVAALEAQRASLDKGVLGEKPEEAVARQAQQAHLTQMIALRNKELQAQEQAITNEAALAAFLKERAVLLEQQQLRIQQAGGGNLIQGAGGVPQLPPVEIPIILQGAQAREELDLVGQHARQAQLEAEKLNQKFSTLTGIMQSVARRAGIFGDIAGDAGEAAINILDVVDSAGQLSKAFDDVANAADEASRASAELAASAAKGNLIGAAIGFGLDALGKLFAGDPEHERIVRENTAALERLTASMNAQFQGVGGQAELGQRVSQAFTATRARFAEAGGMTAQQITKVFKEELEKLGVSMADVERIAAELAPGLDLLHDSGNIVIEAFLELGGIIEDAAQDALTLKNTFADNLKFLDTRDRILGIDQDAAGQFQRDLEAMMTLPDTALDERFAALGAIGPEDEDALRAILLGIIDDMRAGRLTPEEVGGLTVEQLQKIIDDGASALDFFRQSVEDATKTMLNVPTGFKQRLDQLIFENAAFGPEPPPPPEPPRPPVEPVTPTIDIVPLPSEALAVTLRDSIPVLSVAEWTEVLASRLPVPAEGLPGRRGTDGAALPIPGTNVNVTFAPGSIVQRQGEDSVAFAKRVAQAVRDIGFNQMGDTQSFGPV